MWNCMMVQIRRWIWVWVSEKIKDWSSNHHEDSTCGSTNSGKSSIANFLADGKGSIGSLIEIRTHGGVYVY